MGKVLAVIITKDFVDSECINSIVSQTYQNFSWMVHGQRPVSNHPNKLIRLYENCSFNREVARKIALSSDADYFLTVDSDIALPVTAVEEFIKQVRPDNRILGGYYSTNDNRWVAGRWVADNTFVNFRGIVQPSLVATDIVGLGCAFIPRVAMEKLPFESGTDLEVLDGRGGRLLLGECGQYGNRAMDAGFPMFMVGEVVCKHLKY